VPFHVLVFGVGVAVGIGVGVEVGDGVGVGDGVTNEGALEKFVTPSSPTHQFSVRFPDASRYKGSSSP
jgi:hypothetical protein